MKSYLMENIDTIVFYLCVSVIFLVLIMLFIGVYNNIQYKTIKKLYIAKFGRLPVTAAMTQNASMINPYLYITKIGFIFESLIFPYNRVSHHDMSREAYEFIRKMPVKYTIGFVLYGVAFILSGVLIITMLVIYNLN